VETSDSTLLVYWFWEMPLIVLCGYPLSGKTTFARKLESLCTEKNVLCKRKGDEDLNEPRDSLYKDSKTEKTTRARLRNEIERVLDKNCLVVCDSVNYIKLGLSLRTILSCAFVEHTIRVGILYMLEEPSSGAKQ